MVVESTVLGTCRVPTNYGLVPSELDVSHYCGHMVGHEFMMKLVMFTIPLKFLCYYCVCHIKLILSLSKELENVTARITRAKKWLRRGYNVMLVSPRLSLRIARRSNVRILSALLKEEDKRVGQDLEEG